MLLNKSFIHMCVEYIMIIILHILVIFLMCVPIIIRLGANLFFTDYYWCYYDENFSTQYLYTLDITQSGELCMTWWDAGRGISSFHPTTRVNDDSFYPDKSIVDAANYCRNPTTLAYQIWCYTNLTSNGDVTFGIWGYCSPQECPTLGRYRTNDYYIDVNTSYFIGNSTICSTFSSVKHQTNHPSYWRFVGESTGGRWDSFRTASNAEIIPMPRCYHGVNAITL